MSLKHLKIDTAWTLFLDRDGVINRRIVGDYIRTWDQFEFLPGVLESLVSLSSVFGRILVVSNQQGIGKGLMTEEQLQVIHARMTDEIEKAGGRIDKSYHSPFLESENSILRKPNVGMALRARKEFPGINFKRSVMAGDSVSDMIFGKRLGMKTVIITADQQMIRRNHPLIDYAFPDLISFAEIIRGKIR
jgi:D-glycero-D-manno-heptose 1,7-bisphosphate phosphatase